MTKSPKLVADIVEHSRCRVCSNPLEPVMDLGVQHLPGWPSAEEPPPLAAPLELTHCTNRACGLVQLRHTVPPDNLFRQYWYRSGTNEAMQRALWDVVDKARKRRPVGKGDAVMDIGANDGTLLSFYEDPVAAPLRIAIDPARNVKTKNCDLRIEEYFPFARLSKDAAPVKIITAIAMFYDLEDPNAFTAGVADWLHPDGLFVLQVGYLLDMLKQNAFDAICHEHVEYYSLVSLVYLFSRHGLMVEDIELNDVNGGSLRCYVRHAGKAEPSEAVIRQLNIEAVSGLADIAPLQHFDQRMKKIKAALLDTVQGEKALGRPVDVYGASTKGLTLMQTVGLDSTRIRAAADRNPEKWGRFYGATQIPIHSEEQWRKLPPGLAIVLPWHFKRGIIEREEAWRMRGGRLLFPLPEMEVV